MEEWMDVYDVSGKKTGKTVLRGSSLQEGEYVLCTHVILRNSDGRFLIQQRSAIKATRPGVWDITAGAVDAGENSLDGALREAQEEIGLQLSREKMQFLFRDQRKHTFHDVYYICMPLYIGTVQNAGIWSAGTPIGGQRDVFVLLQSMTYRSDNYKNRLISFCVKFERACRTFVFEFEKNIPRKVL